MLACPREFKMKNSNQMKPLQDPSAILSLETPGGVRCKTINSYFK